MKMPASSLRLYAHCILKVGKDLIPGSGFKRSIITMQNRVNVFLALVYTLTRSLKCLYNIRTRSNDYKCQNAFSIRISRGIKILSTALSYYLFIFFFFIFCISFLISRLPFLQEPITNSF